MLPRFRIRFAIITAALFLALAALGPIGLGSPPKNALFIAGPPSHGWNKHEFPAGARLLAGALNASGIAVHASVSEGWPIPSPPPEQLDCLMLFSDGIANHVAEGHLDELRGLLDAGVNLVVLHFALEPESERLAGLLSEALGGFFEPGWSVNPVWTMTKAQLAEHPVTRGVEPFGIEDEWYYHLRFRQPRLGESFTPILAAHPPLDSLGEDGPRSGNPAVRQALAEGVPQILAWTWTAASGRRGFGFTGGHFHYNWANDDFRSLVLNGIAWACGLEVPKQGVPSATPLIVKHESLARAIAYGDAADVRTHIVLQPDLLNQPGRGNLAPLHQAVMRKQAAVTKTLLEMGANPNLPTGRGDHPIHLSISRDDRESFRLLVEADADLAARDSNGWTPLHLAAAKDRIEMARLLIERGAPLDALSQAGGTPLHEAAVSASAEMVHHLLRAGIDPAIRSADGRAAIDIAREYENHPAIETLTKMHD